MRHRREVSRIEGFSDAVFAFAITLIVVSLEVPKTFGELMHVMRAFPAFAVCYALLFQIWRRHYQFFRSYDLEDGTVVGLTAILLFVVLFYVYPLKFVWSVALAPVGGGREADAIDTRDVPLMMEIYSAGVIAVFTLLALLYAHAYRRRDALGLSAVECLDTRVQIWRNAAIAGIGVVSVLLCVAIRAVRAAGLIYFGIGLTEWGLGEYRGRRTRDLSTAASEAKAGD